MKNNLSEKIEKAKELVRMCKLNIKNEESKLVEIDKDLSVVQSRLALIIMVPSKETKSLRYINSQLMNKTSILKKLILELKEELNLSQNNLQKLESNSVYKDS